MPGIEIEEPIRPPNGTLFLAERLDLVGRKDSERFDVLSFVVLDVEGDAAGGMRDDIELRDLGVSPGQSLPDASELRRIKRQDDLVLIAGEDGWEDPHDVAKELEIVARADLPTGKVEAVQVTELLQILRVHGGWFLLHVLWNVPCGQNGRRISSHVSMVASLSLELISAVRCHSKKPRLAVFCVAEGRGFEPPIPCGMLAFQASALDHYATPPGLSVDGGEHSGIARVSQGP